MNVRGGDPDGNMRADKLCNVDRVIQLPYKQSRRSISDAASHERESESREEHVPSVDEGRDNMQSLKSGLGEQEDHGIAEDIQARGTGCDKGPPPMVEVLPAEREIGHNDRHLCTGDGENGKDSDHKAKEVENLILPDGVECEDKLHKDNTEGKDAGENRE